MMFDVRVTLLVYLKDGKLCCTDNKMANKARFPTLQEMEDMRGNPFCPSINNQ